MCYNKLFPLYPLLVLRSLIMAATALIVSDPTVLILEAGRMNPYDPVSGNSIV